MSIHILHLQWLFLVNDLARTGVPQYIFNTYNMTYNILATDGVQLEKGVQIGKKVTKVWINKHIGAKL